MAGLFLGTAAAQAQFFTDDFKNPATATALQPNSGDSPDSNWAAAGLAGNAPTTATIGGGQMSFSGSTSGFSGMGVVSGLSADNYYFNTPVTYTISGFSFSGSADNAAQSWVEIHVGPAISTVSDQSTSAGPGSTLFNLRLNANGQLLGGSLQNNSNNASGFNGAIDSTNVLPGLNTLLPNLPASNVTIALTLSGVDQANGDTATGYKVVISSNGKTLYTYSGVDTHLLKKAWQSTSGEVINQAAVTVGMQEGAQFGTPCAMTITSFSITPGNK